MKALFELFASRPDVGRATGVSIRLDARLQLLQSHDMAVHLLGVGRQLVEAGLSHEDHRLL